MDEEFGIEELLDEFKDTLGQLVRKYGLEESNFIKRMRISVQGTSIRSILPNYVTYIEEGRRSGRKPPTEDIDEWLTEKGISTPSGISRESYVEAIATSIGQRGIAARPFLDDFLEAVIEIITEKIINGIFSKINKE